MLDSEVRHQRYAVAAAVCATALLTFALFNRISTAGPCSYNSFQHSAICAQVFALPGSVPENTQALSFRIVAEPSDGTSPMRVVGQSYFSTLRQLRDLALVRCGVEDLETDAFSVVPHLRRLDLRHNRIRQVSGHQFRGIGELEYLLLSDNPIAELGEEH